MRRSVTEANHGKAVCHDGSWFVLCEDLQQPKWKDRRRKEQAMLTRCKYQHKPGTNMSNKLRDSRPVFW